MVHRSFRALAAAALLSSVTITGAFAQHTSYFKPFSFGGVSFSYGSSLAARVSGATGSLPLDEANHTIPEIQFQFNGYIAAPQFPPNQRFWRAEILVFSAVNPAIRKGIAYETVGADVAALHTLLARRPDLANQGYLPFAQLREDEAELVIARAHYLAFRNGSGIAYLTILGLPVTPITRNSPVLYVFRGLTADGKNVVEVTMPVHVPAGLERLPGPAHSTPGKMWRAWQPYAARLRAYLNGLPDTAFVPYLSNLNKLASSLSVHPRY